MPLSPNGPKLRYTLLGSGASGGVPRLGGLDGSGNWGNCDPANPKNHRKRCALLVERIGANGVTRILVDAGPDIRQQLLDARVTHLDAVLFTHDHADHTHGLDDLRLVFFLMRRKLESWADARTREILFDRFGYAFETPPGSNYPAILNFNLIAQATQHCPHRFSPIRIAGAGGEIEALPFATAHGSMDALGFRFRNHGGDVAYLPDVSDMSDAAWEAVEDLEYWLLDALRYDPHPSHANLETALRWIEKARPKKAVLTNMNIELDYDRVAAETPAHVVPAYDGMVIET
ncbi:MAG: MBL fold metallo-hydrolase [Pseudomonadota bacterium]